MKITWAITATDCRRVQEFYAQHEHRKFVQRRKERNVERRDRDFSRSIVWLAIVNCLVTTRQRSGPNSRATQFMQTRRHPLSFRVCSNTAHLEHYGVQIVRDAGLRRCKTIGQAVGTIVPWLANDGWAFLDGIIEALEDNISPRAERVKADEVSDNPNLPGLGPKQARNLLQTLGLTRYETPIDGRVIGWLNEFGFPIRLTGGSLSDKHYYHFVSDGLQLLCRKAGIYPCLLDAAIFASYDKQEWPDDNIFW